MKRRSFLKVLVGLPALAAARRLRAATSATQADVALMNVVDPGAAAAFFSGHNLYWGDFHAHTAYSDGWGTPEQLYDYARNVRNLRFSAVTDHAEWLVLFKENLSFADGSPLDLWKRILNSADACNSPGSFVTLPAFEWTSNKYGHRCVYFRDTNNVPTDAISSYYVETPEDLWSSLRPYSAITISHHCIRLNTLTKWDHYDPQFERLVEIYSKWGNAESAWTFYEPYYHITAFPWTRLITVRYAIQYLLQQPQFRIGIVAGTDSHQGMPGSTDRNEDYARGPVLPGEYYETMNAERFMQVVQSGYTHVDRGKPGPGGGGLAGVWAPALTRGDIWDAMYARHTMGSTGAKPMVQFAVADRDAPESGGVMGEEISVDGYARILAGIECEDGCVVESAELTKDGVKVAQASPAMQTFGLRYDDPLAKGSTACYQLRLTLAQVPAENLDGDGAQAYDADNKKFYETGEPQTRELVWTSPVWVTRRRPW